MTDNPSEIAELICAAYERGKESVYESDAMRLYSEQKARVEELEARLQGSEARTKEVLESKNYWFDRADKAEKQVGECERSLRAAEALHADDQRELERLRAQVAALEIIPAAVRRGAEADNIRMDWLEKRFACNDHPDVSLDGHKGVYTVAALAATFRASVDVAKIKQDGDA